MIELRAARFEFKERFRFCVKFSTEVLRGQKEKNNTHTRKNTTNTETEQSTIAVNCENGRNKNEAISSIVSEVVWKKSVRLRKKRDWVGGRCLHADNVCTQLHTFSCDSD